MGPRPVLLITYVLWSRLGGFEPHVELRNRPYLLPLAALLADRQYLSIAQVGRIARYAVVQDLEVWPETPILPKLSFS